MTHSYGYKRRTRHKFQKGFRSHGAIHMSTNLTTFKVGDIVDVVVDGAIHKSMPYKYYHGRTGTVFNVNPRALGVLVTKLAALHSGRTSGAVSGRSVPIGDFLSRDHLFENGVPRNVRDTRKSPSRLRLED